MHSALDTPKREADLARLDEMIATSKDMDADLLLDHLQSARQYLVGAMREEYLVSVYSERPVAIVTMM